MKYHTKTLLGLMPLLLVGCMASQPDNDAYVREELTSIRIELEEQGRIIREFYDYASDHIDFKEEQKEREEDEQLLLQPTFESSSLGLSSYAYANPVEPEIAAVTDTGDIKLFDFEGAVLQELRLKNQTISSLAYSPDGSALLVGTAQGDLLEWNKFSRVWKTIVTNVAESVGRVAWLGDNVVWGHAVRYYGNESKKINRDKVSGGIIDPETGETLWTFLASMRNDYHSFATSPDGSKLVLEGVLDQPRGVEVLNGETGKTQASLFYKPRSSGPLSVGIGPDNNTVAVGYAPYDVILWNADEERFLRLLEGHSNWVVSLAFSPDGKLLISGSGDSTARIWSVQTGEELGRIRFKGSSTYVESVGFSSDGKKVFALAEDGQLKIADCPFPDTESTGEIK